MSTQEKITPGKWGVSEYSPEHRDAPQMLYIASNRMPLNTHICLVGLNNIDVNLANAQAIAAVPDMIEALKQILDESKDRDNDILVATEALRKAGQL